MQKLKILGGEKAIQEPLPHWEWNWCPATDNEIAAVVRQMKEGPLNENGYPEIVSTFEKNFAKYHNANFAIIMNSGTSTLHSAFFALKVGPGDEVIAPTLTFPATATPILHVNAVPVLCDCLPDTGTIDPEEIRRKITSQTKAIIITHLWGHPCEMDEILQIAHDHNLPLIEDCSHAHGATYKGKRVGTFGDIACFSLDSQKMMASGEAGVMITNSRNLFERALVFSDFGPRIKLELTIPEYQRFNMTGFGLKYRVHPLAATIANEKFKMLETMNKTRNSLLNTISATIDKLPGLRAPVTRDYAFRGGFFGYKPFYHPQELNGVPLDAFIKIMEIEGMDIRRTGTPPLHTLDLFRSPEDGMFNYQCPRRCPFVKKVYQYNPGDMPISEKFFNETFSLPTFTFENQRDLVNEYCEAFEKVTTFIANASHSVISQLIKKASS